MGAEGGWPAAAAEAVRDHLVYEVDRDLATVVAVKPQRRESGDLYLAPAVLMLPVNYRNDQHARVAYGMRGEGSGGILGSCQREPVLETLVHRTDLLARLGGKPVSD